MAQQLQTPCVGRVIRLTDFCQLGSIFTNWQGRFEQLSSGRFEGALRVVRAESIRVFAVEGNQSVSFRGRDDAGLCSIYPVTVGNAASVWHGRRLSPGQFVVHGPDAETDHRSARQTHAMGLSLPLASLEEAARALLASDKPFDPFTWATLSPPPEVFDNLNRRLLQLLNMGGIAPHCLATPEAHRVEQECLRELLPALVPTGTGQPRLSMPARSQIVRRAEEFMRERLREPLGAIDLCRELDVSDRTLRLAFSERYHLGPMVYYKCLRLNAVRARLQQQPPITIAEVAREYGFHHLGNFAADYRRLFGECPSTTLRQTLSHFSAD